MYRTEDRRRAIELRLKGWSYSQIQNEIKASNGTLNYWLKDYPLTEEQKKKIFNNRELWIEKFREKMKLKREKMMSRYHFEEKILWKELSSRDLMLVGIGLYWGEGQKGGSSVSVSNTDPEVIKFTLKWLESCFDLKRTDPKVRIYLHLYSDMNIEESYSFWERTLGVKRSQFAKPYVKTSTREGLTYKGFGQGTCRIQIGDATMKNKIMTDIKIFSEISNTKDQ